MIDHFYASVLLPIVLIIFLACDKSTEPPKEEIPNYPELIEVASSNYLWTGVAVSQEGRIFVCYPRWSRPIQMSVGELNTNMTAVPYPNNKWNYWSTGSSAIDHFVCVQSVYIDDENFLWILDTGSPQLQGIITDGAKLVKVDISINSVIEVFNLGYDESDIYLNDVRINAAEDYAYITDSGEGSLIIIDLRSGTKRRILDSDESTKAEDITLSIEGIQYSHAVHADGLALDLQKEYLYYKALSSRDLYRIPTQWLSIRDTTLNESVYSSKVEYVARTGASDAIEFGPDGYLYLTSIEMNGIQRYLPDGDLEVVIQDAEIKWPDSFSITSDGTIYFTVSQIHRITSPAWPFKLFKINSSD
jgi:sugar lactone lactonase YvrE